MFIENNQGFTCVVCGATVLPHPTSSRNHCPVCLSSLHVDIDPGDRLEQCRGVMQPQGIQVKEGVMSIIFSCTTCGKARRNVVAPDDNQDLLVQLSSKPIPASMLEQL